MEEWLRLGDPRLSEDLKEEVFTNYRKLYGEDDWRIVSKGSRSYLEVKNFNPLEEKALYFVTSNIGKVESARQSIGNLFDLLQIELDISEDQETIEEIAEHKARVAYSVLCRPVICDDSGLVIPSRGEWPGSRVGRELERLGDEGFANLFKDGPENAYFKMAVTYFDERLERPQIFVSEIHGSFQYERRGNPNKPWVKNEILATRFAPLGQPDTGKTIAQMNEEEYRSYATTDRWRELSEFLKKRK